MKKTILLAAVCCMALSTAVGQSFQKGDKVINLGVGFGTTLYTGSGYRTSVPPISGTFELGIIDNLFGVEGMTLGVGGILGYAQSKYEYSNQNYGWKYSHTVVAARGAVHYQFVPRLDTYGAINLGYRFVTDKAYGNWAGDEYTTTTNSLVYGAIVGARYYLTNNLAVYSELGYDIAYIKLGVALRF